MNQLPPPEPNGDIPSQFVMDCLATENEGDGQLYAALLKDKVLYANSTGRWYRWFEHNWEEDKLGTVLGMVKYVTDRYGDEIAAFEAKIEESKKKNSPDEHKIFQKGWEASITRLENKIKALRKPAGRNACLEFARTNFNNPLSIVGDEFDQNPWLLGVANGVVDLKSGELYPGEPGHMILKHCSCDYLGVEENVDLSAWEKFISTIYDNDTELIAFVQRLLGYGLTGLSTEHVFPFFIGRGRNGKSLLMESVMRVMGSYASSIPTELFLNTNQRSSGQADAAVMALEGLRLAVASEVEEGSRLAGAQIKKITGGDTIEGRNPYDKQLRSFRPTHLTVMLGNHEPVPPTGDKAFWDRTFLIRHNIRFVKREPASANERAADPDIEEKLRKMDSQILSWLVIGCLSWQANGKRLDPPASVKKDTEEYQEDADFIHQWIESCCTTENSAASSGSTELYAAFSAWYLETINNNRKFLPSQRAFGIKLKARDQFKAFESNGRKKYQGIALNPDWYQRMLNIATGNEALP
jgi:putative DNA primase/helicase